MGQGEGLFCQFVCRLYLCPCQIKDPQSPERLQEDRRLLYLLTQSAHAGVDLGQFWSCIAFGHGEG